MAKKITKKQRRLARRQLMPADNLERIAQRVFRVLPKPAGYVKEVMKNGRA